MAATMSEVFSVHTDVSSLMTAGGFSTMVGLSAYLMSYEAQDCTRVGLTNQTGLVSRLETRRKWTLAVMIVSAFFYAAGIVLLALGISLFRDERSLIADTISGLIIQQQEQAADSTINEPAIMAGLAAAVILLGSVQSVLHFNKHEEWGWLGSLIYATGWILAAVAAATNNNSISSIRTDRLVWALVGASLIVGGTYMIPWALHHRYISSPAYALMAFGFFSFSISTSLVIQGSVT